MSTGGRCFNNGIFAVYVGVLSLNTAAYSQFNLSQNYTSEKDQRFNTIVKVISLQY